MNSEDILKNKTLKLFNKLRQQGLLLTIDDYGLVLQALEVGFGGGFDGQDHEALAKLCCTLWVKSEEEQKIFNPIFEEVLSDSEHTNNSQASYKIWNDSKINLLFHLSSYGLLTVIILSILGSIFAIIRGIEIPNIILSIPIQEPPSQLNITFQKIEQLGTTIPEQPTPGVIIPTTKSPNKSTPAPTTTSTHTILSTEFFSQLGLTKEQAEKIGCTQERINQIAQTLKLIKKLELSQTQLQQYNLNLEPVSDKKSYEIRISQDRGILQKINTTPEKVRQQGLDPGQIKRLNITDEQIEKVGTIPTLARERGLKPPQAENLTLEGSQVLKLGYTEEELQRLQVNLYNVEKLGDFLNRVRKDNYQPDSVLSPSGIPLEMVKKFRFTKKQKEILNIDSLPPNNNQVTGGIITIKDINRRNPEIERISLFFLIVVSLIIKLIMSRFVKPIIPETLVHDTHQEPPLFPDVPTLTGNIDKKNQEIKVTGDISIDKLLPITQRQMQQSLRRLCRRVREGVADELDVKATVNEIAVKGILSNLVLKASRVNRAELILLIDREGSMIPFHIASNHLVEIALHSSGFSKNKVKVYYFHNYPNKSELYLNHTNKNDKILLNEIINNIHPHYTSVLIFSDSGAARKKEKNPLMLRDERN
ncbi:hypothetical protein [Tolypothrix sp. PCC 7601]|uniref:hypothetical protein n=1 Tax=Tolypothrix sp. PCC 7601 TaxID=1188 RepID=UPI0005EAC361|nr:hypothetical protein [Tolypothrix sp. PCC 7601]EKE96723.1 hypothetical protein FDUTEX481_06388 [Tolypothrix sp. PCC 7601]